MRTIRNPNWQHCTVVHHPSSGQQHETALGLLQFDDLERNAVFSGGGRWLLPDVALIDESDLHALSGLRLNSFGNTADFGPIIRVGGRDMQSQKMAKRVDGQVELRSLLAFGAVISGASAALRGRAQGPAVDDDGGWLLAPARCKTQDDAQVLSQSLEASRLQPSLRLLVDDLPWRHLSSDAKCNTPRRFGIGKVVQDLKECCCDPIRICRRTKETRLAFCGPRGGRWGPLPGRSVGRKPPSPGSCSGTRCPRADIRRFTPPEIVL